MLSPSRFVPGGDGAFNHFNAPLGHGDGIDLAHNNTPSNSMRSGEGLFDRRGNFICIGQIGRLKFGEKGVGLWGRTDLFNGAFQAAKSLISSQSRNVSRQAAARRSLVNDH